VEILLTSLIKSIYKKYCKTQIEDVQAAIKQIRFKLIQKTQGTNE
jgi:hypothetical protein